MGTKKQPPAEAEADEHFAQFLRVGEALFAVPKPDAKKPPDKRTAATKPKRKR
jgi:hypothetical protein